MQRRLPQAGFTLVEVLVAMVLLAVGMLGASRISLASLNSATSNKHHVVAVSLVEDRFATARRVGYRSVGTLAGTENYGSIVYTAPPPINSQVRYDGYRRVTAVANDVPAAPMRTITVTVFWAQDKHALSATTLMAP